MLTYNEGKVCDAIVRRLEERHSLSRSDVRRPEQEQHKSPVELAFKLGDQLFALEHTGIEPFPGRMEMANRAPHLYAPIAEALKDALGTDVMYELYIPVNAFQNLKRLDIRNTQNALIDWVKTTAPAMPKRSDHRGTFVGPVSVSEVPFQVSLVRYQPPSLPGVHFQLRHVVKDVEKMRKARVQKAIDDKFPKLARWKTDDKAKTIVVLEDNDIQMTNPDIVADAYVPLAQARADRPDETYLVGSYMKPKWYVWPILIGDKTYDDIARSDEHEHWEFDPNTLDALTEKQTS